MKNQGQESKNFYRFFCEQAADGIFAVDLDGRIAYANRAGCKILKMTPRQAAGTHFSEFIAPNELVRSVKNFERLKGGSREIREERNIVNRKGEVIPVEFAASPIIRNGKVVQIHAIVRDISRRKQLEQLVHESEKIQALGNFIAGATQEIQHPLKMILDYVETLLEKYQQRNFEYIGYKEFQEILKTLERMKDQIRYCFDTTRRLLTIHKRKIGLKNDSSDVNAVIRETVKSLEHELGVSGIRLRLRLSASLPKAAVGVLELGQITQNVLTNAVESISSGGHIEVRTKYLKKENRIGLECRDDGIGIPKENLSRVMDPFFTTKPRGLEKSSGLGLSVVYALLTACEGTISITSHLRRGALVKIGLPVFQKHTKKRKIEA